MSLLLALALFQARVYFSSDSLIQRLKVRIDSAQRSIDLCFYDLDSSYITGALRAARGHGVRVRVITDYPFDASDVAAIESLRRDRIPVSSDSGHTPSYEMHNKFAVFDYPGGNRTYGTNGTYETDPWLWTGSYNVTIGTFHADNVIEVQDSGLAHAYTQEFEQMWGGSDSLPDPGNARFHNEKADVLNRHWFFVGNDTFRVYPGPENHALDTLSQLVARAQSEVSFSIFSFSRNTSGIADNMIRRFRAGVWVGGAFDRVQAGLPSSAHHVLRDSGLPVFLSNLPPEYDKLHEKIMVIDRRIVVTGSPNWSDNVNNGNDENLLIIHSPAIAQRYLAEISRRYEEAGGNYPQGWMSAPDFPLGPRNKRVKEGCALAYADEANSQKANSQAAIGPCPLATGSLAIGSIYALKGNNTCEFYSFSLGEGVWTTKESIPERGRSGRKRQVKKGATLVAGPGTLYATKGGNTLEFWQYSLSDKSDKSDGSDASDMSYAWTQLADVPPGASVLRVGTSAAAVIGLGSSFVYLLKASGTNEFLRYYAAGDDWEKLPDAPLGPNARTFKSGSGIAFDGTSQIYVLKGRENEFYAFDINTHTWTTKASLPMIGRSGRRKAAGAGTGIAYHEGVIYAVKAGNTLEFWRYDCALNQWAQGADLPVGGGKRMKGGAIVAPGTDGMLYVVKGNNTLEFLSYGPLGTTNNERRTTNVQTSSGVRTSTLALRTSPNPFSNTASINYSLPQAGRVSLKLYDVTGKLISTLTDGYRPAGNSSFIVHRPALSPGCYVLRLETAGWISTAKLIIR